MEEEFEREERLSYDPFTRSDAFGHLGNFLLKVSRAFALCGGLIFLALVVMQLVSVVGRKLFSFAVPGDVEMLQMCAAIALSSFFAYCHLIRGDIKVDFFTHNLSPNKVAFLDAIGSLAIGLFGALIAWRTAAGALSVKEVGETSPILAWPVWIPQMLMVPGFVLLAVAGFYMCAHQLRLAFWKSL
ncbi:TRAP transporter small permease [Geobacter argillaceus]|jgi:TRAP-type C4-dicarboxylate transport system permease small subunit|uniref:TRAP-type mannitol/chloroaromatic compound transport system permease small subunit n=1 Tax=Geobacter argillaceus TaxID=345631 RepID=A0A562WSP9_9BACT|nr:TRAP transporter small permease [Geobacter argillaceus]TWJ33615.1 TRAP-type mannitol/chloroaromatic compound transport system permease small subunit [Geobacter argillaceus]